MPLETCIVGCLSRYLQYLKSSYHTTLPPLVRNGESKRVHLWGGSCSWSLHCMTVLEVAETPAQKTTNIQGRQWEVQRLWQNVPWPSREDTSPALNVGKRRTGKECVEATHSVKWFRVSYMTDINLVQLTAHSKMVIIVQFCWTAVTVQYSVWGWLWKNVWEYVILLSLRKCWTRKRNYCIIQESGPHYLEQYFKKAVYTLRYSQ